MEVQALLLPLDGNVPINPTAYPPPPRTAAPEQEAKQAVVAAQVFEAPEYPTMALEEMVTGPLKVVAPVIVGITAVVAVNDEILTPLVPVAVTSKIFTKGTLKLCDSAHPVIIVP